MMLASFTEDEFKAAFDQVDTDKSGNINYGELQKLLDIVYMGPAPINQVTMVMDYFDRNHDGVITKTEFELGLKSLRGMRRRWVR